MSDTTTAPAPTTTGATGATPPATLFGDGGGAAKPAQTPATAAAPKPAEGGAGGGDPKPIDPAWKNWSPERRGYFENKGWLKGDDLNVDELATAYEQLEKFKGVPADEAFRLSKNPTQEELDRVLSKLGVPKDAAGYGLKAGEGQDPKVLERIAATALGAKATPAQVQAFLKLNEEMVAEQQAAEVEAEAASFAKDGKELARDWGSALEQNKAVARRAANLPAFRENGLDEEFWAAAGRIVGPGKVARALHALGVGLGEDTFVHGEPTGGGKRGPESAQARLDEMIGHEPTRKALLAGDPKLLREKAAMEEAIIAGRSGGR